MYCKLNKAEVGKRIRQARDASNMSREKLAEQVPMSASFLADVEGGTKCLSLEKFYRVIKILNVSADYILQTDYVYEDKNLEKSLIYEKINHSMEGCDVESLHIIAEIVRNATQMAKKETD